MNCDCSLTSRACRPYSKDGNLMLFVMLSCVTERLVQSSGQDFPDPDSKLFASIILARALPDDATITTLKDLFPGATEIAFPRQGLGPARYARLASATFAVSRSYLFQLHFPESLLVIEVLQQRTFGMIGASICTDWVLLCNVISPVCALGHLFSMLPFFFLLYLFLTHTHWS